MKNEEIEKSAAVFQDVNESPNQDLANVPPQYRDLPADVVEELLSAEPTYIDKGFDDKARAEQKGWVAALRAEELRVAKQENNSLSQRLDTFGKSGSNIKAAQEKVVSEFIAPLLASGLPLAEVPGLSAHELNVLTKMSEVYKTAKAEKPDEPVQFQFSQPADQLVYDNLIAKRALAGIKNERVNNDQVAKERVIAEVAAMQGPENLTQLKPESFSSFKFKNGDTDTGAFWNEYSNEASKQLEKEGKFEWGKERLYFDIPYEAMEGLRDLVMRLASEKQIPIQFKYLDLTKSTPAHTDDPSTTRFVGNFASTADAKRFYQAIQQTPEYQALIAQSRGIDYKGHKLDEVTQYASGYRERREALERVVRAQRQPNGNYEYVGPNGNKVTYTEQRYNEVVKEYQDIDPKKSWEKA